MAFVKLKKSQFNCGTIFTFQVSFAMDPSMCLQITSSFPLWVQMMLCPFPIITDPFIGVRLYAPILFKATKQGALKVTLHHFLLD